MTDLPGVFVLALMFPNGGLAPNWLPPKDPNVGRLPNTGGAPNSDPKSSHIGPVYICMYRDFLQIPVWPIACPCETPKPELSNFGCKAV